MAPQAIKRRKLSHDIDLRPGASPFEGQQNISDEPLTNSSDRQSTSGQVNAPMAGQMSKTSTGRYDHHSDIFLAGEAHKSSMFKLQMEELLAEIRPKHAHHSAQTERVLRKLKATIESFPQREPLSVRLDFGLL